MARKSHVSAAILELMGAGARHAWTLEELHAALALRGRASDFSSVFRAAEKLAAAGRARRLLLEDGRTRFELTGAHHDHLYCTRCHAIEPVPCVIAQGHLQGHFAALERRTGAAILEHHLILSGLCRNCRASAGPGGGRE
jgi:Fur family ferric uptake transcriptional regulator